MTLARFGTSRSFPLPGFAIAVGAAPCLIEDSVGCSARVLAGQAWITAEGVPEDTIAGPGVSVPLAPGVRVNLSAFRGTTTVLISAPAHLRDVGFNLQDLDGISVLRVAARRRPLTWLAASAAAIAAVAKRCLAMTRGPTL
jgi:hypothetical protein